MKNKSNIQADEFRSVEFFRKIKAKIAKRLAGMTFQEKKEYIKKVISGQKSIA